LSVEGAQAWDLVTQCGGGQVRVGPAGGVGLDMPALLAAADALGYRRRIMARLLPYIEVGMVAALARAADRDRDQGEVEQEP